ncbi:MAG: hypothetical protein ABR511_10085 [Acidimicrobiales bacterium]
MPVSNGPTSVPLPDGLSVAPAGPVAAQPGQAVELGVRLPAGAGAGRPAPPPVTAVTWTVTDLGGRPLVAGRDFLAPDGLCRPTASFVFPTQLAPAPGRARVQVRATVSVEGTGDGARAAASAPAPAGAGTPGAAAAGRPAAGASAGAWTLAPVTVTLPVLGADQVRALLVHVGRTLRLVTGRRRRSHLIVAGPRPTLDLVGRGPLPVTVTPRWGGRGCGRGARPAGGGGFRLSVDVPGVGPIETGLLSLPASAGGAHGRRPRCGGMARHHHRRSGPSRPGPFFGKG